MFISLMADPLLGEAERLLNASPLLLTGYTRTLRRYSFTAASIAEVDEKLAPLLRQIAFDLWNQQLALTDRRIEKGDGEDEYVLVTETKWCYLHKPLPLRIVN